MTTLSQSYGKTISYSATPYASRRLRILLLSPYVPYHANNGAAQRTLLLYRSLQKLGDVDFFHIGEDKRDTYKKAVKEFHIVGNCMPSLNKLNGTAKALKAIKQLCKGSLSSSSSFIGSSYATDPSLSSAIDQVLEKNEYDFAVGRYLRPTAQSGILEKLPTIIDIDDVDSDVYQSYLRHPGINQLFAPFLDFIASRTQKNIDSVANQASHLLVAKNSDLVKTGSSRASVLPNIPIQLLENPKSILSSQVRSNLNIIFIGGCGHWPNRLGISHFLSQCWPKIVSLVPHAKIRIYGAGDWRALKNKFSHLPGVIFEGYCSDLQKAYRESMFTIAPIYGGSGTKIKVLESLYFGRTVVGTTQAFSGFETIRDGESACISSTDDAFISSCVSLLKSPDKCQQMAQEGQRTLRNEYSFEANAAILKNVVNQIMPCCSPQSVPRRLHSLGVY